MNIQLKTPLNPKKHLWSWFEQNNAEIIAAFSKNKRELRYWLNELDVHILACNPKLSYGLVINTRNKTGELTITALGKIKYFMHADELVSLAPNIPKWKIHALNRPLSHTHLAEYFGETTGLNVDDLWFYLERSRTGGQFVLHVYHVLVTAENRIMMDKLIYRFIYELLGEFDYTLNIDNIVVKNLSIVKDRSRLIKSNNLVVHLKEQIQNSRLPWKLKK